MLVNLCDYKQSVTLIANSGVQFLDFGLTPKNLWPRHHGHGPAGVKLAAMEGEWQTEPAPAPFHLIAWPQQEQARNAFAVKIPALLYLKYSPFFHRSPV